MENEIANISFEDFKHQNGITYWWASEYSLMLGYPNLTAFKKAIDRAVKAFLSLGIEHYDNIVRVEREVEGVKFFDYKLTRFACYIIAMNADPKKPQVAEAQRYFAVQTRRFEEMVEQSENLERLMTRDEIKEGNKLLSSTVKASGVEDYARFNNAGYRGMYNMLNTDLARRRGVDPKRIFETMGRTELAANLFRITQTEERISSQGITGQANLEGAHFDVGREVRNIVIRNTGKTPENLPQSPSLPEARKEIKKEFRQMKKLDK